MIDVYSVWSRSWRYVTLVSSLRKAEAINVNKSKWRIARRKKRRTEDNKEKTGTYYLVAGMIRASVTAGKNEKGERKEGSACREDTLQKPEMMATVARQKTRPAVYKVNV